LTIVPGIFLGFFGSAMLDVVLMFIGFAVGFFLSMKTTDFVIESIFKTTVSMPLYVGLMVVCCFIGVSIGFCLKHMRKLAMGCLGGAFGYVLGVFLMTSISSGISETMYYGIIIGCAFFGVMLAMYFEQSLIMGATAFLGAYFICMGVGYYAGGFPNVHMAGTSLKNIGGLGYVYLAAIVAGSVGCYIFQLKRSEKSK
jgi:hypothetical protein